jgi:acetylornithine deacetylase/succinyl-diaminopimelate desuccinylase-like protein
MAATAPDDVVPLLQTLIRNRCVNDDTKGSGDEHRNATVIRDVVEGSGNDAVVVSPAGEGRGNVIARIEGSDPSAPSLCLMGHLDVVPANASTWQHDPFGGELVDGEVWGRGAVDMLNQTAAMTIAFRRLADAGFRPKGTLVLLGAADEEAGGSAGVGALLEHHRDEILTDYCLTEFGGLVDRDGKVSVGTAEKGGAPLTLIVRGRASHGSVPYGTDNALVTAAEVVRRISVTRGPSAVGDTWRQWVHAQGYDPELTETLLDPDRLWEALPTMSPGMAGHAHACTHLTAAPTMVKPSAQQKLNIIPDEVRLGVDIRLLPGQGEDDVRTWVADVLDGLEDRVEVDLRYARSGTTSPTDTPLWASMARAAERAYADARLLPSVASGTTDARWLRPAGVVTYGFGLLSRKVPASAFWSRFHGKDERIDLESLALSVQLWEDVARDFLG